LYYILQKIIKESCSTIILYHHTDLAHVVGPGLEVKACIFSCVLMWIENIAPMLMSLSAESRGREGWLISLQTCAEAGTQTSNTTTSSSSSSSSSDTVLFAMPIWNAGQEPMWQNKGSAAFYCVCKCPLGLAL